MKQKCASQKIPRNILGHWTGWQRVTFEILALIGVLLPKIYLKYLIIGNALDFKIPN